MTNLRYVRSLAGLLVVASTGCSDPDRVAGIKAPTQLSRSVAAGSVVVIDISNGVNGGNARTISSTGLILGGNGARGWWQSPSPTFTVIDNGNVQGGNRNADAGGGQGTAILSTNGRAPWTSIQLASPSGIGAGATLAHDVNAARVLVGNTLGSNIYAIRWDNPSAVPTRLPLPPFQYPANQVVARSINNTGTIVGYAYEILPKNRVRYEALVWTGGSVSILPLPPGGTTQLASNVNDAGIISGITEGSHPIRWTPRAGGGYDVAVSTIDVGRRNLDTGIDACGRITGGSDQGAWVWDGVSAVILPGLVPGKPANGNDISESGTVVGFSEVGTSKGSIINRATIWTGLAACGP